MIRVAGLLASLMLAAAAQAQTPLDSYLTHLKTLRADFSQVVTDGKGVEVQQIGRASCRERVYGLV